MTTDGENLFIPFQVGDQPVVVGVAADPKPHHPVWLPDSKRSPPQPKTNGIDWLAGMHLLEAQTGMPFIAVPQGEGVARSVFSFSESWSKLFQNCVVARDLTSSRCRNPTGWCFRPPAPPKHRLLCVQDHPGWLQRRRPKPLRLQRPPEIAKSVRPTRLGPPMAASTRL